MRGYSGGVDYKIYQMSFFVGYPIAVCTYIINKIWPPEGLGIAETLPEPEDNEIIEGSTPENLSGSEKDVGVVQVMQDKTVEI
jgi:NCS1 family nucleobase:cation symporter-1